MIMACCLRVLVPRSLISPLIWAHGRHKLLQRACRSCGENIVDDGIIGPVTRSVIQAQINGPC